MRLRQTLSRIAASLKARRGKTANSLIAVTAVALVVSIAFGYGAARMNIDIPDGFTWIGDSERGEVIQINPDAGRPELRIPVSEPGTDLGIAQRGDLLVVTDRGTGEVNYIDLATLRLSGQSRHSTNVKTLLTNDHVYLADLTLGEIHRVDPRTSKPIGTPWTTPAGPLADATIDATATIWALDIRGQLIALRWADTSGTLAQVTAARTVSGAGRRSALIGHDQGVTVISPESGSITQIGGGHSTELGTQQLRGQLYHPDSSPDDLVPVSAPQNSTVVISRGGTLLSVDMTAVDCHHPGKPVVFRGHIYVPCLNTNRIVVLNQDGHRSQDDLVLPTNTGTPQLVVDDGRLIIHTPGNDAGILVNENGTTRPIRTYDDTTPTHDPNARPTQSTQPTKTPPPSQRPITSQPTGTSRSTSSPTPTGNPGPPPPPPEALPHPTTFAPLASSASARCLGPWGGSTAEGVPIVQHQQSFGNEQCKADQFNPVLGWGWVGGYRDGTYKIVNQHTGMCLDVQNGSSDVGATIVQMPCRDSGGSQLWYWGYQDTYNGWHYGWIANARSGHQLFLRDRSHAEGGVLEQQPGIPWHGELQFRYPAWMPTRP